MMWGVLEYTPTGDRPNVGYIRYLGCLIIDPVYLFVSVQG